MIELRAQQGICAASCNTYHCYKGGPAEGEGQATGGCPVYSHPAQLSDNRNCVLCMACLKACPHRSVELNLRPPGIELWSSHQPLPSEVALLFLLAGAVVLHHLPQTITLFGLDESLLGNFWIHFGASVFALLLPGSIALLAQLTVRNWMKSLRSKPFISIAYSYLPLVLFASLAHYLHLGLSEAGQLLPVAIATFKLDLQTHLSFVADPAVTAFLQGSSLITGCLLSMVLTQKIAVQPIKKLIPQHLTILGGTGFFWMLIL